MNQGRLYYVVGASGSGKDTLIRYARKRIKSPATVFAHRYITRPAENEAENHISLSRDEFQLRVRKGLFCMWWQSHNLQYGIGSEVQSWIASGINVVVNGSRAYLQNAVKIVATLDVVLIHANKDILKERLEQRGRETAGEIEKRLQSTPLPDDFFYENIHIINNSGSLIEAGQEFVRIISLTGCKFLK